MAELQDAMDSKSIEPKAREGWTPSPGTNQKIRDRGFFCVGDENKSSSSRFARLRLARVCKLIP